MVNEMVMRQIMIVVDHVLDVQFLWNVSRVAIVAAIFVSVVSVVVSWFVWRDGNDNAGYHFNKTSVQ